MYIICPGDTFFFLVCLLVMQEVWTMFLESATLNTSPCTCLNKQNKKTFTSFISSRYFFLTTPYSCNFKLILSTCMCPDQDEYTLKITWMTNKLVIYTKQPARSVISSALNFDSYYISMYIHVVYMYLYFLHKKKMNYILPKSFHQISKICLNLLRKGCSLLYPPLLYHISSSMPQRTPIVVSRSKLKTKVNSY